VCTIVICPNCGKETPEGKFCEHCGASVQTTQTFQQPVAQQPVYTQQPAAASMQKKSAGVAVILSFFLPGLGQIYNGQIGKGIGMIILSVIFWLLSSILIGIPFYIILWIYGMYNAYSTANKINAGAISV
jgi:TM2 domain-containing membrane protein YozV/ribosomal protein L32